MAKSQVRTNSDHISCIIKVIYIIYGSVRNVVIISHQVLITCTSTLLYQTTIYSMTKYFMLVHNSLK